MLNLIYNQQDIDKIYLYAKDPYEVKYQFLIRNHEDVGRKHLNDPKTFIEYSNDIQDVFKSINKYNLGEENKVLIVFSDMTADMISNKKPKTIVAEIFIRGRKLNISLAFITQSYFNVTKEVRLTCTHFFIMKIPMKF